MSNSLYKLQHTTTYTYSNNCAGCHCDLFYNNRTKASLLPISIIGCICIERQYCINCLLNQSNINQKLVCPACAKGIESISIISSDNIKQSICISEKKYSFIDKEETDSDSKEVITISSDSDNNNNNNNNNNNSRKRRKKKQPRKCSFIECPNSAKGCNYIGYKHNVKRHYNSSCEYRPKF